MFKYIALFALLAVAFAEPKPGLVAPVAYSAYSSPVAYSAYSAPVVGAAYAAPYAAPYAYSAGYVSPYAYSAYAGAPVVKYY